MIIRFEVRGRPKTAGSKRYLGHSKSGKPIIRDDCATGAAWKADVRAAALAAYQGPLLTGPLRVKLRFGLARPRGHYGRHGLLTSKIGAEPTTRPDLLKLARAVEDACTGVLWRDDAQIVFEELQKVYSAERNILRIEVETP